MAVTVGLLTAPAASGIASAAAPASIATSPSLAGDLFGVSCPSATICMAVGTNIRNGRALVERWNGTTWGVMQGTPSPAGYVQLLSVSCPSTTSCFAVGADSVYPRYTPLIEHWNGHGPWSMMSTPNLTSAGHHDVRLLGVSCPSTTSCMAVGGIDTKPIGGAGATALIEHWNGNHWSVMTGTPNLSSRDGLSAVSCADTTSCVAVGDAVGKPSTSRIPRPTPTRTLVEHWHGRGAWSIMNGTPSPSPFAQLSGVSCPTPTNCFAVGDAIRQTTHGLFDQWDGLVEHWNGRGAWSIMTGTIPNGIRGIGGGISCPNTAGCFAARSDGIANWDGTGAWHITTDAPPDANLAAISCSSTTTCFAVGTSSDGKALIEQQT